MAREAQIEEVGWDFHSLLIYSRVFLMLRWMMLEKVLRGDAP
jgi:hypothetical protein